MVTSRQRNNSELVKAKAKLDAATAKDPTPGMTPATADNYRAKKQSRAVFRSQGVITMVMRQLKKSEMKSKSRRSINSIN